MLRTKLSGKNTGCQGSAGHGWVMAKPPLGLAEQLLLSEVCAPRAVQERCCCVSLGGDVPHGKNRVLLQEIRSQRYVLPAPPLQHWRSVVENLAMWLLHGDMGFMSTGFMEKYLICA